MFDAIRKSFFQKSIQQVLDASKREQKTFGVSNATTIGILFDATNEKQRSAVLTLVQSLEKKGKKITALAYFNAKEVPANSAFKAYSNKEINWKGIPTAEQCQAFAKQAFHLLICFNPGKIASLEWIAATSRAYMKTGIANSQRNDYDLQLDIPADKPIQYFIEQLEIYLDKIILKKYESAAAL